jgi:hypothetical protein
MKFLEKDLEQIIYEADNEMLLEKGLVIILICKKVSTLMQAFTKL